jgi:hypothetical protein
MNRILLSVLMILIIASAKAQVPQHLNYQGVARNASGSPITYQNITVRISLIDSAAGGEVVPGTQTLPLNQWSHIVATISGSIG